MRPNQFSWKQTKPHTISQKIMIYLFNKNFKAKDTVIVQSVNASDTPLESSQTQIYSE